MSSSASKVAIRAMGTGLALELAKSGVRINPVFPGAFDTALLGGAVQETATANGREWEQRL